MFCPNCGQRQTSNDVRFCSACGFPLNVVSDVLAGGGRLHWRPPEASAPAPLTPRQKGIRQGTMLMLSTLLVVPLIAIFGVAMLDLPGELVALAAVICFMGGLLRILYALMLENHARPAAGPAAPAYVPPPTIPDYLGAPVRGTSLPPPPQGTPIPAQARPQRYHTGELVEPPRASVTEHTTRLLDKQPTDEPPSQ